jgi:hypothetical protein
VALEYTLKYNCGPVAQMFHADRTSRVKLLIGPFGTGKTTSAAYDMIDCASQFVVPTRGKRRSRFAVVRNTYPELRDTTIKTFLDWFPPLYFGKYNSSNKTYLLNYEDREIELIFKALDSPQDVRDLLSLELTGAHVDEAREIHQTVVKGLLGRIGRFPSMKDTDGVNPFIFPPQVLLTTNYPSSEHWLHRDFVSKPIEGYRIYEQTQEENKHNLRPNYYEDLEKDYADRTDLLKTLVRGEWGVTVKGKQVYPEFNRSYHVSKHSLVPEYPVEVIRGWDNTGLCPAINLSYLSATGQWCIFKEFCFDDTGIMDATEAMLIWCAQNLPPGCKFVDYGDPAGKNRDATKQSPVDYIRAKGEEYQIDIFMIDGIQTFKTRREAVANRLSKNINGKPALIIDPSCVRIIDGFDGGYAYPEIGNSGTFKTEPAKNEYSHIADSVQYPATRLFASGSTTSPKKPLGGYFQNEDEDDDYSYNGFDQVSGRNSVTGY